MLKDLVIEQYPLDPKDRIFEVKNMHTPVVLVAHNCHELQAEDGLSGVAVAKSIPWCSRIICPEGHSQDYVKKLNVKYAIYLDAVGNTNKIRCNRSGDSYLDKVAKTVFCCTYPTAHKGFRNDEYRLANVGVPCLMVHRFPYPEYHTPMDTPEIVHEERLLETQILVKRMLDIIDKDFTPVRGPKWNEAFTNLKGHGLWTDWHINRPMKDLKEEILFLVDGYRSVLDISIILDEGFHLVYEFLTECRKEEICRKSVF